MYTRPLIVVNILRGLANEMEFPGHFDADMPR